MDSFLAQALVMAFTTTIYGVLGSLVLTRNDKLSYYWGTTLAFMGSLSALVSGVVVLFSDVIGQYKFETPFPLLSLSFRVDQLSGVFLVIIGGIGALATIYGVRYMRQYEGKYRLGGFSAAYNLFLASMMLVVVANQALFFLLAWELMALASYLLVIFDHRDESSAHAGYLYFIMTHIATAFIILLSFIFYRATGSLEFDVWRVASGSLPAITAGLIFSFALIGFGTKAGIIPLHVWLPAAHPAAPSHVSALMSGVMIKLGVYMLIRIFMDFFLQTPMWLGVTVLILGALSSVFGVLYALAEHDIKRLLAYHSIENIGIILLGLGAALVFRTLGNIPLSLLALSASLFHVVNHAIFKSLLFMSAGSVVHATGTRNIEEYGGLGRRMPYTALFFLIGSIAISGIVPFNGFVSEWLTFQSLFGGIAVSSIAIKSIFVLAIAALALTGGLAAACFVKAFGITFLARPRSRGAECAHDSGTQMNFAMGVLASIALLLGVFGTWGAKLFFQVAKTIIPSIDAGHISVVSDLQFGLSIGNGFALLNMVALFTLLSFALFITWLFVYISGHERGTIRKITWDCGFPLNSRMEITSTAFAHAIITIFRPILHSTDETKFVRLDANAPYFVSSKKVHIHLDDLYMKYCYAPLAKFLFLCAKAISRIQNGYVNMYVLYVLLTLVALFAWAL